MTGDDETAKPAKPMPEAGAAINNQKTNFDPIAVGDEIAALESEAQNAKVMSARPVALAMAAPHPAANRGNASLRAISHSGRARLS